MLSSGWQPCESLMDRLVPKRGLEPPRPDGHYTLNVARLPIPPLRHAWYYENYSGQHLQVAASAACRGPPGSRPCACALASPFTGKTPTSTGQAPVFQGENSPAASTHGAIRVKLCQVFSNLGSGVICETRALQAAVIPVPPRREESTPQTFGNALSTDWIPPAVAGRE